MNNLSYVEIDRAGKPLVSRSEQRSSRLLLPALTLLFYIGPVSIGLNKSDLILVSPLVKYVGIAFGYILSVISWGVAFLTAGLVLGKFNFAKVVFHLSSSNEIQAAVSLLFLLMPFTSFLSKTINKTATDIPTRSCTFWWAMMMIIASVLSSVTFISQQHNYLEYLFSLGIAGVLYLIIFFAV